MEMEKLKANLICHNGWTCEETCEFDDVIENTFINEEDLIQILNELVEEALKDNYSRELIDNIKDYFSYDELSKIILEKIKNEEKVELDEILDEYVDDCRGFEESEYRSEFNSYQLRWYKATGVRR